MTVLARTSRKLPHQTTVADRKQQRVPTKQRVREDTEWEDLERAVILCSYKQICIQ
jgi:hypothetical protein